LIFDSGLQAKGMRAVADRCDTYASVNMMDLSLEAEAFGASIKFEENDVPSVVGSLVETVADAEALKVPEVGAGRTGVYVDAVEQACRQITDRPVFAGIIGPFTLAANLISVSKAMLACIMEPEIIALTVEKTTEYLIKSCNAYKQVGANGIIMAEMSAGLLGPKYTEQFSEPYVKKLIDAVQTDDFSVIYHNCGTTIPIVESIKRLGAHAYHFGNAIKMEKMLGLVSADMICLGNVDPAGFIVETPQQTYDKTTELLNTCSKHPNFIVSSGCDIPPNASWDNIDLFFDAVKDFYA
jgi:uroporphyrinogen decarboxylase